MTPTKNDYLFDFWYQYYCHPTEHLCTLCGNSGVIHTEGIRSPAGVLVGRANYCICPNGLAMRERRVEIVDTQNPERKTNEATT